MSLVNKDKECPKLKKFPHVCVGCSSKNRCNYDQYRYDAVHAQKLYEDMLHNSRKGINLTKEEFARIDTLVKEGLKEKKSIYEIVHTYDLVVSEQTIYRYIDKGYLSTIKIDLHYAVKYKKRKKKQKEYDYKDNKIDRSDRTYIDFLSYRKSHLNEMTVQMDFLGSIRSDKKSILVLIIPELLFPFLFLVENRTASKVVTVIDSLEEKFGFEKFNEIFPSILTDRDPCFSDIESIEKSKFVNTNRTNLFFCDPYRSTQKPNVENINKQLRQYFPKGRSIDNLTEENVFKVNKILIERPLHSLDGATPKDAFIKLFGLETFTNYFDN